MLPNTANLVRRKQGNQKEAHDYQAKYRNFKARDPVFVKNFSSPKSWKEGTIVHTTRPVSALVELQNSRVVRRHQVHFRRIQNATKPEPEMSVPEADPAIEAADPQPRADESPTPETQEAKPSRPVRNRRLPQLFKDYEL